MKTKRTYLLLLSLVALLAFGSTAQTVMANSHSTFLADQQSSGVQQAIQTPAVTVNVTAQVNVTSAPQQSNGGSTALLIIVIVFVLIILVGILINSRRNVAP